MLRRILLGFPVLPVLLAACLYADQPEPSTSSPNQAQEKDAAERVFAGATPKVVFLLTRKAGALWVGASGIILTADGYIATNYHAVQGADSIEIRYFHDPQDLDTYQSFNGAKLLYANPDYDIAVLKVNAKALPFLECPAKTGCEPRVGERVYAIGNPKGLTNTISEGIVSALRTSGGEDIIQHTAPVSPGSSGGALLDSTGGLLGMNSWQLTEGQNLNFAISSKHILEALEAARSAATPLRFPPDTPKATSSVAEEPWDRTAIRARFVELATSDEEGTINFWYRLTNTTDADYRIGSFDDVETAGWAAGDTLYNFNQGVSFETPIIIPAHGAALVMLHVVMPTSHLSVREGASEKAVRAYKRKVTDFLRSEFADFNGVVILDERVRYRIDLPLDITLRTRTQAKP